MASKSRYIPALDGLRALAVVAVLIYHMNATWLPGGLLGVTMFFVLSGYLITGLLIKEWSETRTINLPQFWLRRVRRLLPAVAFLLLVIAALTAFIAPDILTKLRRDLAPALLFVTNWWYIFQDVSYFEAMGAPSPVTHFWSLAIEEQFYLIWPPLLLLLFRKRVKRPNIQRGLLAAAAMSAVLMAVLYVPNGDPSRAYYGTDTRAFSLIVGSWMAFAFPSTRMMGRGRRGLDERQRRVIGWLGFAALAGILAMMWFVNGYSPFLYYGGTLLLSLLTGVLMLSVIDPRNPLARFFSLRPLVWTGKLSYSIYLWHYPILLLMNPRNFTGDAAWYMYVLQVIVIFAAAAVSYYLVETPIRRGLIGNVVKEIRSGATSAAEAARRYAVPLAVGGALFAVAAFGLITTPATETQTNTGLTEAMQGPAASEGAGEGAEGGSAENTENTAPPAETLADTPGDTPAEKAVNTNFLLIGDSVTVALSDNGGYGYFGGAFPRATLDAAINRQLRAAKDLYLAHVDAGWNGPVVIFEVGTNGVATADQVRELLDTVPADKQVFLVNVRTPAPLQDINNDLFIQAAAERDNVSIIDWYSTSANHDEYFDGDGTHLTGKAGCEAYVAMLTSALQGLYEE